MKLFNFYRDDQIRLGVYHKGIPIDLNASLEKNGFDSTRSQLDPLILDWVNHVKLFDAINRLIFQNEDSLVELKENVAFAPPLLDPGTFRDFYAFEEHVRNARKLRGLDVAVEWYKFPVFYFSNPNTISGFGDKIQFPRTSQKWDFELEIGAILGKGGSNLTPQEADNCIAGYTILNDWSARDLQREEMAVSLGPAKGKDFATSIGPLLVTPDEIEDKRSGKGFDLRMQAKINGETVSDNNWKTIHYSFGEMIARASQDASVYPGELFGSGTVGMGCLLERGLDHDLWLKSGDVVELEIEGFGVLRNIVG